MLKLNLLLPILLLLLSWSCDSNIDNQSQKQTYENEKNYTLNEIDNSQQGNAEKQDAFDEGGVSMDQELKSKKYCGYILSMPRCDTDIQKCFDGLIALDGNGHAEYAVLISSSYALQADFKDHYSTGDDIQFELIDNEPKLILKNPDWNDCVPASGAVARINIDHHFQGDGRHKTGVIKQIYSEIGYLRLNSDNSLDYPMQLVKVEYGDDKDDNGTKYTEKVWLPISKTPNYHLRYKTAVGGDDDNRYYIWKNGTTRSNTKAKIGYAMSGPHWHDWGKVKESEVHEEMKRVPSQQ